MFDPARLGPPGSIGYVYSTEEYQYRVCKSSYFYVSRADRGIDGFLMCCDDQTLEKMIEDGRFHHDGVLSYLSRQEKPFIYGETIAIDPCAARKNVGTALMNQLFEDMIRANLRKMHVLIRHRPARNDPSISFCKKLGFDYTGNEIQNHDLIFTWGVYVLDLGKNTID